MPRKFFKKCNFTLDVLIESAMILIRYLIYFILKIGSSHGVGYSELNLDFARARVQIEEVICPRLLNLNLNIKWKCFSLKMGVIFLLYGEYSYSS